jgi:hypothetical protein
MHLQHDDDITHGDDNRKALGQRPVERHIDGSCTLFAAAPLSSKAVCDPIKYP